MYLCFRSAFGGVSKSYGLLHICEIRCHIFDLHHFVDLAVIFPSYVTDMLRDEQIAEIDMKRSRDVSAG